MVRGIEETGMAVSRFFNVFKVVVRGWPLPQLYDNAAYGGTNSFFLRFDVFTSRGSRFLWLVPTLIKRVGKTHPDFGSLAAETASLHKVWEEWHVESHLSARAKQNSEFVELSNSAGSSLRSFEVSEYS